MKISTEQVLSSHSPWFKSWFDSSFYHQLYANRDENEAATFINELLTELKPAANSNMLDLGCGAGRHARHLASHGYRVTGLDLSSSSIREAKKSETDNLRFYRQDMRDPFGVNQFDYVFSFFTSFGYFKDTMENLKVISNISDSLKPGGILVMDYINTPWSEKRIVPYEEKEVDGIVYHISRWTDDLNFYKKIVIDTRRPEGSLEYTEQVTKFSLIDFENLFYCHGLHLQDVYGDYKLNKYDEKTSSRLILTVKKVV